MNLLAISMVYISNTMFSPKALTFIEIFFIINTNIFWHLLYQISDVVNRNLKMKSFIAEFLGKSEKTWGDRYDEGVIFCLLVAFDLANVTRIFEEKVNIHYEKFVFLIIISQILHFLHILLLFHNIWCII